MTGYEELFGGNFETLQIIGLIIAGFLVGKTIIDLKKERLTKGSFVFWIVLWSTAFVTFLFPRISQSIFSVLDRGDSLTIALVLANTVLFVIVYVLISQVTSLDKQLKKLVQKLALNDKIELNEEDRDD